MPQVAQIFLSALALMVEVALVAALLVTVGVAAGVVTAVVVVAAASVRR